MLHCLLLFCITVVICGTDGSLRSKYKTVQQFQPIKNPSVIWNTRDHIEASQSDLSIYEDALSSLDSDRESSFKSVMNSPQMEIGESSNYNILKNDSKRISFSQEHGSDEMETEIRSLFNEFKNNDGVLSFEELKRLFNSINEQISDEAIKKMIQVHKADDGNYITYGAFKKMMMLDINDDCKAAFDLIDTDKKGYITTTDIHNKFSDYDGFTLKTAKEVIETYGDVDKDMMTYENYQTFWNEMFK